MADDRNERVRLFQLDFLVGFFRQFLNELQGNREIAKIIDQFKQHLLDEEKAVEELEQKKTEIGQAQSFQVSQNHQNFQQFEDRRIAAAKRAQELADLEAKAKVRG